MNVEITFLTGRFHATPWGRHVNEAVAEWPPSPFRLVRALLDVWYRKHPELSAASVERVLAAMSKPPVYRLPNARAGHTRSYLSQNKEDPTDKKLVFDGFAILDRDAPVVVGWPEAELDAEDRATAATLVGAINYLGRSESWVAARLVDDSMASWNCTPLREGRVGDGEEVVSVAGIVSPQAFASRPFEVPAKGKKPARRLAWLEAIGWGSSEAIEHALNRPPALEPTFYVRARDALDARPPAVRRTPTSTVEAVRFAVEARVPAPLTDAIVVAEHVRRHLLGAARRVVGYNGDASLFTGKNADGRPLRGHRHVSILPLDEDRDGFIDAILLVAPRPLTVDERCIVDRIEPIPRKNGHSLILTPQRYASRDELLTPTRFVRSLTPFAPWHHWRLKRDGDETAWLLRQLSNELESRGLPRVVAAERTPPLPTIRKHARWLDFRRARKNDGPQPAYGLRLELASAVQAPFSVGYASHFGLGCFVPSPSP